MEYKILKILDKYRVVADIPANSGVRKGDEYIVYSKGDEVRDPNTNELIDHVEDVKATLKVIHVQKKFSILESNDIETYTEENPLFSSLSATARLFGPRVRKVLKPLPVEEVKRELEKEDNKLIRIGDLVKKNIPE